MRFAKQAVKFAGGVSALARKLNVTRQCVSAWQKRGVSKDFIGPVERATGGKVKAADLWNEKRGAA